MVGCGAVELWKPDVGSCSWWLVMSLGTRYDAVIGICYRSFRAIGSFGWDEAPAQIKRCDMPENLKQLPPGDFEWKPASAWRLENVVTKPV